MPPLRPPPLSSPGSVVWLPEPDSTLLACQRPFPAAVEDAYAVLRWAARRPASLGWSGERLLTAGIEAGGNLAAVAALVV